jgi:glucose/arabinose dehydrogenase
VDQDVKRIEVDGPTASLAESLFSEFNARIRAVTTDDQGAIYLLTDDVAGAIIKISRPIASGID